MGSANHSPDLSAKLKTSQDKLDKDALQRGKNFSNYYTNAYHVQKDEKKESWTHLGPDLNLTYLITSFTNLLLYYTTFSLITPRDYTLPYPTICYLMLTCSSLLYAILSRSHVNGCLEC